MDVKRPWLRHEPIDASSPRGFDDACLVPCTFPQRITSPLYQLCCLGRAALASNTGPRQNHWTIAIYNIHYALAARAIHWLSRGLTESLIVAFRRPHGSLLESGDALSRRQGTRCRIWSFSGLYHPATGPRDRLKCSTSHPLDETGQHRLVIGPTCCSA